MIREIVKDTFFLSQKSEPATRQDQPVIQDLLDTVRANADRCVGMAANMIGERKTILVAQAGKDYLVMVNPKIVDHSKQCYETEESCLSLTGQRPVKRYSVILCIYKPLQQFLICVLWHKASPFFFMAIPHKDCATDASSNFSSDETKSGVNT